MFRPSLPADFHHGLLGDPYSQEGVLTPFDEYKITSTVGKAMEKLLECLLKPLN